MTILLPSCDDRYRKPPHLRVPHPTTRGREAPGLPAWMGCPSGPRGKAEPLKTAKDHHLRTMPAMYIHARMPPRAATRGASQAHDPPPRDLSLRSRSPLYTRSPGFPAALSLSQASQAAHTLAQRRNARNGETRACQRSATALVLARASAGGSRVGSLLRALARRAGTAAATVRRPRQPWRRSRGAWREGRRDAVVRGGRAGGVASQEPAQDAIGGRVAVARAEWRAVTAPSSSSCGTRASRRSSRRAARCS